MRRLLLLFLFPISLMAQVINFENFSHGTVGSAPTPTDMGNALYGTLGTCCFSGQTPFTAISNSNSTLTYSNATVATDGGPPASMHSGLLLDYSTTQGNGQGNQIIFLRSPNEVGTLTMGSFWFTSNIPVTDAFGTSNDFLQVIGGNSRLANYNSNNGTTQNFGIEACTGPCQGTIPYTPGHTVLIAWQHLVGAACVNSNHTDCVRLAVYDRNLNLIGEEDSSVPAGASIAYETLGNGNAAALSSGHHMQFSDIWTCWIGCTASMFPLLPNSPELGLITSGRYTDWTKAGFTIPSASWTQCGSTIAAYTGTAATINNALAACGANQYVLLGPGTFSLSTGISYPTGLNKLALRGSGANSTFLTFTGSPGVSCGNFGPSLVCMKGGTPSGNAGTQTTTWTSGFPQGSTTIGVGSSTGITTTTALLLNVADTGYSGDPASGCAIDNSQWFNTGDAYSTSGCNNPNGLSQDGGNGFNTGRQQVQLVAVTNISGTNLTITPPIIPTNIPVSNTPDVYAYTPAVQLGLENLSIDGTGVTTPVGVAAVGVYQGWTSGVKIANTFTYGFNGAYLLNYDVQDSYVYHIGGSANPYGIRCFVCSSAKIQNNIIQQVLTPFSFDGPAVGSVVGYNTCLQATPTSNLFQECYNEHGPSDHNIFDGNYGNSIAAADGIHNSSFAPTLFRNFLTSTVSAPPTLAESPTQMAILHSYGSRGANDIANITGTPAFPTNTYQYTTSCSPASNHIYIFQIGVSCQGNVGSIPNDTLSGTSLVRYGNWDSITNATRWCGNSLNTNFTSAGNCNSISEAAPSFSTYPGFVPVVGDTTAGQPPLPPSLYLGNTRPAWWNVSIPYPAVGPDVSSGNVGYCTGTWNTTGQMAGVPVTAGSQCPVSGTMTTGWAGHVAAIPSLAYYLSKGGAADGSGPSISFNAADYYGTPSSPIATFTPPSPINFGQVQVGNNKVIGVTLQNTGTANLVVLTVSLGSVVFSLINNTCGSPSTITNGIPGTGFTLTPGQSCTFNASYTPAVVGSNDSVSVFFSPGANNPDQLQLSGQAIARISPTGPALTIFSGIIVTNGVSNEAH